MATAVEAVVQCPAGTYDCDGNPASGCESTIPCATGAACVDGAGCASGVCGAGVCQAVATWVCVGHCYDLDGACGDAAGFVVSACLTPCRDAQCVDGCVAAYYRAVARCSDALTPCLAVCDGRCTQGPECASGYCADALTFETRHLAAPVHPASVQEAIDTFNGLPQGFPGYGFDVLTSTESFRNRMADPHRDDTNFGSHLAASFVLAPGQAGVWRFRLGPDYGLGGTLLVDGTDLAHFWANPSPPPGTETGINWGSSWDEPSQILANATFLGAGRHHLEAYGFENCCDGVMALELLAPGLSDQPGNWRPISEQTLTLDKACAPAPVGAGAACNQGTHCVSGSCIGGVCAECAPGATQCAGDVVETCDAGGHWQAGITCFYACASGRCAGAACSSDADCATGCQQGVCDRTARHCYLKPTGWPCSDLDDRYCDGTDVMLEACAATGACAPTILHDCTPYICGNPYTCTGGTCESDLQCAPGYHCALNECQHP